MDGLKIVQGYVHCRWYKNNNNIYDKIEKANIFYILCDLLHEEGACVQKLEYLYPPEEYLDSLAKYTASEQLEGAAKRGRERQGKKLKHVNSEWKF